MRSLLSVTLLLLLALTLAAEASKGAKSHKGEEYEESQLARTGLKHTYAHWVSHNSSHTSWNVTAPVLPAVIIRIWFQTDLNSETPRT